jgi:hypothetical protein
MISAWLCACQPTHGPGPAPSEVAECALAPAPLEFVDSVNAALTDPVDFDHAPQPANDGERFLFSELYGSLIQVDCLGNTHPGLAESWTSSADGRRWTFLLRKDAASWDGRQVTAGDVVASWLGRVGQPAAAAAGIDSARAAATRIVWVFFDRPYELVPRVLAEPGLAVYRRSPATPWPIGTGRYRLDASSEGAPLLSEAISIAPVKDGPAIDVRVDAGADPRDLLEGAVDLLVTSDPAVIEYAATLPQFKLLPLDWDRTYLLLSTTRLRELRRGGTVGEPLPELIETLTRDAVRADARPHQPPSWWEDDGDCDVSPVLTGLPPIPRGALESEGPRRIVYPSADPTARDLAERFAALMSSGSAPSQDEGEGAGALLASTGDQVVALGLDSDEFEVTLHDGDDFAYVFAVPFGALDDCYQIRRLAARAEWLAASEFPLAATVLPLVDTRRHAIFRIGRLGLARGWNGNLHILEGAER